jgi:hypothetical protein
MPFLVGSRFARFPLPVKNDPRKHTKQKFCWAISCDFVNRCCASQKKHETTLEDITPQFSDASDHEKDALAGPRRFFFATCLTVGYDPASS